jgi:hypothetical protein
VGGALIDIKIKINFYLINPFYTKQISPINISILFFSYLNSFFCTTATDPLPVDNDNDTQPLLSLPIDNHHLENLVEPAAPLSFWAWVCSFFYKKSVASVTHKEPLLFSGNLQPKMRKLSAIL